MPEEKKQVDRKFLRIIILPAAALFAATLFAIIYALTTTTSTDQRIANLLKTTPLIDGHNDLPAALRVSYNSSLEAIDLTGVPTPVAALHTDFGRMRKGMMGGQFWADFSICSSTNKNTDLVGIEQTDLIKRMIKKYNDTLQFVTTANGIWQAFNQNRIASLIGLEGGHMLDSSLGALRIFYSLGVRYMTLTHSCSTPWADASPVDGPTYNGSKIGGLSDFGRKLVLEMNRLGMIIDLSHVSKQVQIDVLNITRAPIMYSHSSAYALCNHHRNVHDDVIELVKKNRGVIMVNSYPIFVTCSGIADIGNVTAHINYIKTICGSECVGIGADFDGIEILAEGFEDVSKYPDLLENLITNYDWSDDDLRNFVGLNIIRVLREVEEARDKVSNAPVDESIIPKSDLTNTTCRLEWP